MGYKELYDERGEPMRPLQTLGEQIDTDVLIIGGGIAGLLSALTARDVVDKVTVVDKGFVGKTSHSALSFGAMMALLPGDDIDACVKDLAAAQDWLIDQDVVEYILSNSLQRLKDMEAMGMEQYHRAEGYFSLPARGTKLLKIIVPAEHGIPTMLKVKRAVLRKNVQIMERIYISDLLTDGEKVVGAVGTDTRSGEFKIFKAKATVIATNTAGFRGHYMGAEMVGDGPKLAYLSGAEITNAEFDVFNSGSPHFYFEGTGPATARGAKFRNASGEAFMERYDPELKDRADLPRIARAMTTEMRHGRGPFFFDLTAMTIPIGTLLRSHGYCWRPHLRFKLEKKGIKLEKPEWMPVHFYNLASLKTSFDGATNLCGLFAAGKARSCGPSILAGWSWTSCIGTGFQVGQSAGEHARSCPEPKIDNSMVASLKDRLYQPLERESGAKPDKILKEVQQTVFPYDTIILKSEERLTRALEKIEWIKANFVSSMVAKDMHELIRLRETESVLLNAEMMLKASLMRQESRSGHFREDFPERNDRQWLKWIVIKRGSQGEMELQAVPVPIDKFRFHPFEDMGGN